MKKERPESLRVDQLRFLPLTDPRLNITDMLLVGYNGAFAQRLEMDRQRVRSFAKATPDLPIVLQDQPYIRHREKPEGSSGAGTWSNKGILFEYISPKQSREESCYQVEPIDGKPGWNIRLNGGKMRQDLLDHGVSANSPVMVSRFANRMDFCFRQALVEMIIRDKLTMAKQKSAILYGTKIVYLGVGSALFALNAAHINYAEPSHALRQIAQALIVTIASDVVMNSAVNVAQPQAKSNRSGWEITLPPLPLEDVARGIWEAYRPGKFIRPIQKKAIH